MPEAVEVVVVDVPENGRDAAGQLIVAQMQVPRISQAAQLRRYLAGQPIVVEPQMLQAVEPSQFRWYRASEVFGCLNQSGGPAPCTLTPSQLALGVSMLQFSVAVPLSVSLAASMAMQSRIRPGVPGPARPSRTAVAAGSGRTGGVGADLDVVPTQRIGVACQHERSASPPVRLSHSATRAWCAEVFSTANYWLADPDVRIGPGCPFGGPFMFARASYAPTG